MVKRSAPLSSSLSLSPTFTLDQASNKRKREPSFSELPARDTKPKVPRRIDPDKLAVRLGPELTSEMDAYIVPGAKMPSFEIRQGFVKKYSVDRRHIYDYFHSRGLRVAKEDKHLNLSHRMTRKPGRKPPAARKASTPKTCPASTELAHVDSESHYDQPAIPGFSPTSSTESSVEVPFVEESCDTPISPAAVPSRSKISTSKRIAPRASRPRLASETRVSPLLPSLQSIDLCSDSSDSDDDRSPMFDFTDSLTDSSSFGEDLSLLSLGQSASEDELCESFGFDFTPFPPAAPDDFVSDFDDLCGDIPVFDPLLPLDSLSLSATDRMELYNLIDAGIGPAQGIEERSGTYKTHMDRLYQNRTYPGAHAQYDLNVPRYAPTPTVTHNRPPTMIEKENLNPQIPAADPMPFNTRLYRRTPTLASASPRRTPNLVSMPLSRFEQPRNPSFVPNTLTTHLSQLLVSPNILDPHNASHTAVGPPPDPASQPTPLVWMSPIKPSPSSQWQSQLPRGRGDSFTFSTFFTQFGEGATY
ncbi:hypothetical protein R3P38DRAFT_2820889 [Favolaschia claudopus]|uniref:Uncharacterized protein n=1 Tax=Favolaschia claudopus TaxID=2862362 RepID=A0AAW0EEJ2_9AGAR